MVDQVAGDFRPDHGVHEMAAAYAGYAKHVGDPLLFQKAHHIIRNFHFCILSAGVTTGPAPSGGFPRTQPGIRFFLPAANCLKTAGMYVHRSFFL